MIVGGHRRCTTGYNKVIGTQEKRREETEAGVGGESAGVGGGVMTVSGWWCSLEETDMIDRKIAAARLEAASHLLLVAVSDRGDVKRTAEIFGVGAVGGGGLSRTACVEGAMALIDSCEFTEMDGVMVDDGVGSVGSAGGCGAWEIPSVLRELWHEIAPSRPVTDEVSWWARTLSEMAGTLAGEMAVWGQYGGE